MNSLKITFRQKFLTGLVVTIPFVLTIFILSWVFDRIDGILSPVLDYFVGYHIYGLGIFMSVFIIFIIGVISTTVFGNKIVTIVDKILKKIPIFKGIYTALSQITHAFSPHNKGSFKKFVIVEYPRKGVFAFGFLTKECVIKENPERERRCVRAVYIPTNNLYLGEIVLLHEAEVIETTISIEEGIKIILSGGIAIPDTINGVLH